MANFISLDFWISYKTLVMWWDAKKMICGDLAAVSRTIEIIY